VLLGTIASSFGYVIWVEAYYIFKYGLEEKISIYVVQVIKYIVPLGLSVGIIFYTQTFFQFGGFRGIIVKLFLACAIGIVLYVIMFFKTQEFAYLRKLLFRIIKR
jgi:hypothetical protein